MEVGSVTDSIKSRSRSQRNARSIFGVASHASAACPARGRPENDTQATAFFFISMGRTPPPPSRQAREQVTEVRLVADNGCQLAATLAEQRQDGERRLAR